MADIADRPGADLRLRPHRALGDQRAGARRKHDLHVLIGAGERERIARRAAEAQRAVDLLEAREPRPRIGHPVDLAVLAVVDDVDPGIGLPPHHVGDRARAMRASKAAAVVSLAQLLGVEQRHQIGRPRQAAGVGGEDPAVLRFMK